MIVVTTPTGQIGGQLLSRLLAAEAPVRVIVRDAGRLPASVRDRVEIVEGSHGDAAVVAKAFDGAQAVFWLAPPNPAAPSVEASLVDFSRPACAALRAAGVPRVVGVSALGRGTPMADRAGHVTASLAMDDLIAGTGVAYRALALPGFMDNVLRQVDSIRTRGEITWPIAGDRKAPLCATRDIAAVGARLLLDPTWDGVEEVPVLGPEDLSLDDMARVVSEVLGRPVRYRQVGGEEFTDGLVRSGMTPAVARAMLEMLRAKEAGLDNAVVRTERNSTPTTFRQWCEEVLRPAVGA